MDVRERLKALDWNGDGKIDIEDARAFFEEHLDRARLRCYAIGFVAGLVVSAIAYLVR